jgi:hypothetical protein
LLTCITPLLQYEPFPSPVQCPLLSQNAVI